MKSGEEQLLEHISLHTERMADRLGMLKQIEKNTQAAKEWLEVD
jgi:hypothetical protein